MSAQATRNGLDEETRVGDDETRLGKIAGAYGGLTHLRTREAWNQAAGRFQVAGVAKITSAARFRVAKSSVVQKCPGDG